MSTPFIPYTRQSISESDISAVIAALQGAALTRGPLVNQFEEAIAGYCGAKYAVAFNSASTALHAACFAAQVGASDQFFTTPNTFIATAGAGVLRGVHLQFIDIDRSTGNLDISKLMPYLKRSEGRYVILPVHFAGIAMDIASLQRSTKPDTIIIEDASHAIGSLYPSGERVGCCAFSQMTVFSFHAAKTITTGEGGAVTTNDPSLCDRLRLFRNNGIVKHTPLYYEVVTLSNNTHLTDIQAALGLSQLERLEEFVQKRRLLVKTYREQLATFPHLKLFTDTMDAKTAFHLLVVQIDFTALGKVREEVAIALRERGIGTQVHYIPLYRHPVFIKMYGEQVSHFKEMERYYAQALTLPLFPGLSQEDVYRIVAHLKEVLYTLTA